MMSNKLKFNAEKSHILTLGTKERLNNLQSTVCIKIEGAELTEDANKQEILLGCQISSGISSSNDSPFFSVSSNNIFHI